MEKKAKLFKIYIEDLTFETIIGILKKERKIPQKVVINCIIKYKYTKKVFINYAVVSKLIEKNMIKKKYKLLEDALLSISKELKAKFPQINSISLKISKPNILDNLVVSVEIKKKY